MDLRNQIDETNSSSKPCMMKKNPS